MRTVRVWFNHWFSAAYLIIQSLKQDGDINFVVIGSNTSDSCVYRAVCDEWAKEQHFGDFGARGGLDGGDAGGKRAYIDYCLDFCREHRIDVFVPRRNMQVIAEHMSDFDAIGVKVLAERDAALLSVLNDKIKTYEALAASGFGYVPPYRLITSVPEFEAAFTALKTDTNRVCFKFARDAGAVSFRVIDERARDCFRERIGSKITYADAAGALSRLEVIPEIIVMPYLKGPEISVDCLAASVPGGRHIVIPRYKSQGRCETVRYDAQIISICEAFLDQFKLQCPCNIQFRYDGAALYLLEVNTRMAGGLPYSAAATGVNIPNIAVNKLLGINKNAVWDRRERTVSHIETPVILGSENTHAYEQ